MAPPKKKAQVKTAPAKSTHPGAYPQMKKTAAVSLVRAAQLLKAWRKDHPDALQLDAHPGGRNNLKPWFYIKLDGFTSPRHDCQAKHSGELILGHYYNGVWNLHGDAKAAAISGLIALVTSGADPLEFFLPAATHEQKTEHLGQQNPKLTLRETTGVKDLFLYQT